MNPTFPTESRQPGLKWLVNTIVILHARVELAGHLSPCPFCCFLDDTLSIYRHASSCPGVKGEGQGKEWVRDIEKTKLAAIQRVNEWTWCLTISCWTRHMCALAVIICCSYMYFWDVHFFDFTDSVSDVWGYRTDSESVAILADEFALLNQYP